jgi:hypothetical protein
MGPSSMAFICLTLLVVTSVFLLLLVSAARGGGFLCSDVLAASATLLWSATREGSDDRA